MRPRTILFISVLCCRSAFGQSIGANVAGTVVDQTAALLQDAAVTITHTENGRVTQLRTGQHGDYRAVALLPGAYTLVAERDGFAPAAGRLQAELLIEGFNVTNHINLRQALQERRSSRHSEFHSRWEQAES